MPWRRIALIGGMLWMFPLVAALAVALEVVGQMGDEETERLLLEIQDLLSELTH